MGFVDPAEKSVATLKKDDVIIGDAEVLNQHLIGDG